MDEMAAAAALMEELPTSAVSSPSTTKRQKRAAGEQEKAVTMSLEGAFNRKELGTEGQDRLVNNLKNLLDTIEKLVEFVSKCSRVGSLILVHVFLKALRANTPLPNLKSSSLYRHCFLIAVQVVANANGQPELRSGGPTNWTPQVMESYLEFFEELDFDLPKYTLWARLSLDYAAEQHMTNVRNHIVCNTFRFQKRALRSFCVRNGLDMRRAYVMQCKINGWGGCAREVLSDLERAEFERHRAAFRVPFTRMDERWIESHLEAGLRYLHFLLGELDETARKFDLLPICEDQRRFAAIPAHVLYYMLKDLGMVGPATEQATEQATTEQATTEPATEQASGKKPKGRRARRRRMKEKARAAGPATEQATTQAATSAGPATEQATTQAATSAGPATEQAATQPMSLKQFKERAGEYFRRIFKVDHLVSKRSGFVFSNFIATDGVSVRIHFRRKDPGFVKGEKRAQRRKRERKDMFEFPRTTPSRVIAIDPGRTTILHAVEMICDAHGNVLTVRVWKFTRRQYYAEAGLTESNARTTRWRSALSEITRVLDTKTTKTTSLEAFSEYCVEYSRVFQRVWEEMSKRRWAHEKFRRFCAKRRAIDRFLEKLAKDGEPYIAYGGATFPSTGRGERAVPTSSILRRVAQKFDVTLVDEWRTSQVCHKCHDSLCSTHVGTGADNDNDDNNRAKRMRMAKAKAKDKNSSDNTNTQRRPGREIRGLRWCNSITCNGALLNRDTNAALNIRRCFLEGCHGRRRPVAMTRGDVQPGLKGKFVLTDAFRGRRRSAPNQDQEA